MANGTVSGMSLQPAIEEAMTNNKILLVSLQEQQENVKDTLLSLSNIPLTISKVIKILSEGLDATLNSKNWAFAYNAVAGAKKELSFAQTSLSKYRVNIAGHFDRLDKSLNDINFLLLELRHKYPQVEATIEQYTGILKPIIQQLQILRKEERTLISQCERATGVKSQKETIGHFFDTIFLLLKEEQMEEIQVNWADRSRMKGKEPTADEAAKVLGQLISDLTEIQEGISTAAILMRTKLPQIFQQMITLVKASDEILRKMEPFGWRMRQLSELKKI
jgi:hypothetical protein